MKLHPVTHDLSVVPERRTKEKWCGPAAISAITGRSAECAAGWINKIRDRGLHFSIRGSSPFEMRHALDQLGYRCTSTIVPRVDERKIGRKLTTRPTFAQWLKHPVRDRSKMYLVDVGNHWMVVKGTKVVCALQPDGVPTGKSQRRRSLVKAAHIITHCPAGEAVRRKRNDPIPEVPKPKRKKPLMTLAVIKRRLDPGIEFDYDGDCYNVFAPKGKVFDGGHLHCKLYWGTRSEAVAEMATDLDELTLVDCPTHDCPDCYGEAS